MMIDLHTESLPGGLDLSPDSALRRRLEAGLDTLAWGAERVLETLARGNWDGFPMLNHLTGTYSP